MKQRYSVRRADNGVNWIIYDNQLNAVAGLISHRSLARTACQRLNASEALERTDQQQSLEETI